MRKTLLLPAATLAGLTLFACLTAPDEPSLGADTAPLTCSATEKPFNGACRTVCTSKSQCAAGQECMAAGDGLNLCLPYTHCAHLASDTACAASGPGGYPSAIYGSYGYGSYGYGSYGGYGQATCVGNATWKIELPIGDPACGEARTVQRCRATTSGCALVGSTTTTVAEP